MTPKHLCNDDEVLFRQIHPIFFENGHLSSSPFVATMKDDGKLSVDRSAITTAKDAFVLYTGNGFKSCGVVGLAIGEFRAEDLLCLSDPIDATDTLAANPAHAYADYAHYTSNQIKNKAKRLKQRAISRGVLYQAD